MAARARAAIWRIHREEGTAPVRMRVAISERGEAMAMRSQERVRGMEGR